jgi:hypothetical protein
VKTPVALFVLAVGLALITAGCGSAGKQAGRTPDRSGSRSPSTKRPHEPKRGPFVTTADFVAIGGEGVSAGNGVPGVVPTHHWKTPERLSCVPNRLYVQAVTVRNRSRKTVTLTRADREPALAPRIIHLVVAQLIPRPRGVNAATALKQHWQPEYGRPVNVRPGRQAIVETFVYVEQCRGLAGGRTVVVPGDLSVTYRTGGETHIQTVSVPNSRVFLPTTA